MQYVLYSILILIIRKHAVNRDNSNVTFVLKVNFRKKYSRCDCNNQTGPSCLMPDLKGFQAIGYFNQFDMTVHGMYEFMVYQPNTVRFNAYLEN